MVLLLDADSMAFASCYVDGEEIDDLDIAFEKFEESFRWLLQDMEDRCGYVFDDTIVFIGNHGNFRKVIFPEYKANRKKSKYPDILQDLKLKVAEEYNGIISVGFESDDSIASTWNMFKDMYGRNHVVIASIDKDIRQLPCLFYDYYFHKDEEKNAERKRLYDISEEEGDRNFWKQMLTGDSTDNVSGVKGIGDKRADKVLDGLKTNFSMMIRVYRKYREVYGEFKGRRNFATCYHLLRLRLDADTPIVGF